jgi:hypothetical protein
MMLRKANSVHRCASSGMIRVCNQSQPTDLKTEMVRCYREQLSEITRLHEKNKKLKCENELLIIKIKQLEFEKDKITMEYIKLF